MSTTNTKVKGSLSLPPMSPRLDPSDVTGTLSSMVLWCSRPPMLILFFYLGYYLSLVLHYPSSMTANNWANSTLLATLIGVANNSAAIGSHSLLKWFCDNPFRFIRFFCIPFCVSSMSVVAGNHPDDFFLVFPSDLTILSTCLSSAVALVVVIAGCRVFILGIKYGPEGGERDWTSRPSTPKTTSPKNAKLKDVEVQMSLVVETDFSEMDEGI